MIIGRNKTVEWHYFVATCTVVQGMQWMLFSAPSTSVRMLQQCPLWNKWPSLLHYHFAFVVGPCVFSFCCTIRYRLSFRIHSFQGSSVPMPNDGPFLFAQLPLLFSGSSLDKHLLQTPKKINVKAMLLGGWTLYHDRMPAVVSSCIFRGLF